MECGRRDEVRTRTPSSWQLFLNRRQTVAHAAITLEPGQRQPVVASVPCCLLTPPPATARRRVAIGRHTARRDGARCSVLGFGRRSGADAGMMDGGSVQEDVHTASD